MRPPHTVMSSSLQCRAVHIANATSGPPRQIRATSMLVQAVHARCIAPLLQCVLCAKPLLAARTAKRFKWPLRNQQAAAK